MSPMVSAMLPLYHKDAEGMIAVADCQLIVLVLQLKIGQIGMGMNLFAELMFHPHIRMTARWTNYFNQNQRLDSNSRRSNHVYSMAHIYLEYGK